MQGAPPGQIPPPPTPSFCGSCGRPHPLDARFCRYCGRSLALDTVPLAAPPTNLPPPPPPVVPPPPTQAPPVGPPIDNGPSPIPGASQRSTDVALPTLDLGRAHPARTASPFACGRGREGDRHSGRSGQRDSRVHMVPGFLVRPHELPHRCARANVRWACRQRRGPSDRSDASRCPAVRSCRGSQWHCPPEPHSGREDVVDTGGAGDVHLAPQLGPDVAIRGDAKGCGCPGRSCGNPPRSRKASQGVAPQDQRLPDTPSSLGGASMVASAET